MTEKQKYLKEYINNLAISLNKQYRGILSPDKVQKYYDMFKDSPKDISEILKEIEDLKTKAVKRYIDKLERERTKTKLSQIDFNKSFQIKGMDNDGHVFVEDVIITTNGRRNSEGTTKPLEVYYNNKKGYYKPSLEFSADFFSDLDYIICQLGKKLGISMAETYKLYQDDVYIGIISEDVAKKGDIFYMAIEMAEMLDNPLINLTVDKNKLQSVRNSKAALEATSIKISVGKKNCFMVDSLEEIRKVIMLIPKLVDSFQIPAEQKQEIENNYYKMLVLDLLTGNVDRGMKNYGIIYKEDGSFQFSPLFDNAQIFIPNVPKNAIQINGFMMNRNRLLDVLYQNYYDKISGVTRLMLDYQEDYKKFIDEISSNELDEDKKNFFCDTVIPFFEEICECEKKHSLEQSSPIGDITWQQDTQKQQTESKSKRQIEGLELELTKAQSKDNFNSKNSDSNPLGLSQPESKILEKGKQKTIGTYPKKNATIQDNGYINGFMLSLIIGFILGSIFMVAYLVLNMGKYTFII